MAESKYKLIPLRQANRYAGYQFWGRMRVDGLEGKPAVGFQFG